MSNSNRINTNNNYNNNNNNNILLSAFKTTKIIKLYIYKKIESWVLR
jgi:hypothetical protein